MASKNIIHIDDESFDEQVLGINTPVLLDFVIARQALGTKSQSLTGTSVW